MSLTWGKIRKLYLNAIGSTGSGDQETYLHLTEGYRRVAEPLDIPELIQPEATYTLSDGDDYFDTDVDVFAIKTIVNITAGHEMYPESGGMTGRNRYIESTTGSRGKPPKGTPTHYVRAGNRIYVRDTASESTTLQIQFKVQVPEITDSDINDYPLTPQQYDMAIVHAAVVSYLRVHPEADSRGEGEAFSQGDRHERELLRIMNAAGSQHPRAIEDKPRLETMRLSGYRIGPF